MAEGEDKGGNFYTVLGLDKECSNGELRSAYKKLAMRWHPDRCYGSGNSAMEEAKSKFQEIHEAYSVLSDTNKRLLYDVGVYQSDDDDHEMGDFLDEMAALMSKTTPCSGTPQESFAELQSLFVEMFETNDLSAGHGPCNGLKRNSADMSTSIPECKAAPRMTPPFHSSTSAFCFGSRDSASSSKPNRARRHEGRKQKASSRNDAL